MGLLFNVLEEEPVAPSGFPPGRGGNCVKGEKVFSGLQNKREDWNTE
jgi:hypothetical protein